jgi:hypothetical protein
MKNDPDLESPASAPDQTTCCASSGSVATDVSAQDAVASELRCVESEVSTEAIRENAYSKWQAAGCPSGNDLGFWFEAESELRNKT